MPEGQRLPCNVRHQRRAAVHPQDRGGLRRESVRAKGPVQVSMKKLFSEEEMRCLTVLSSQCVDVLCRRRFWVGYQYVITNQNHSLEGRWEVAYKGWFLSRIY